MNFIVSIFSAENVESIALIANLLILSLFAVLINIPLTHYLLGKGENKKYMYSLIRTTFFDLGIGYCLIFFFGVVGAAIGQITTRLLLFAFLFINSKKVYKNQLNK